MSISLNLSVTVVSRVALGLIGIFVIGLLTRSLGPSGYGYYSFIFAYLYIFSTIADLGLGTILVREISKDNSPEHHIVGSIFSLRFVVVLISVLIADLIIIFLPYPQSVKTGVFLASIFIIFSSLTQVLLGIFQKYLKIYYVALADIISRIIQLGLVFYAAKEGKDILTFIWIVVISEIVHFGLVFVSAQPLVKVKFIYDKKHWAETIKTAIPIAASLIFILIYFRMDTVLLSLMKPAKDVGIYSVAYKLLEAVIFLPAAYVGLIMPKLSNKANDPLEFKNVFKGAFDNLAIFALPLAGFLVVDSHQVIKAISGSGFEPAGQVLKILSIGILLIFFGTLGGNAMVALNIQKRGMWIYLAGAVVNLVTNLIFIPRYSYIAASWTTVITEVIVTISMYRLIYKSSGALPGIFAFLKAGAASVLMMLLVWFLNVSFIFSALVAMSYFGFLYIFKGFDKKTILEIIGR